MTLPFWKVEPTRTWDDFDVMSGHDQKIPKVKRRNRFPFAQSSGTAATRPAAGSADASTRSRTCTAYPTSWRAAGGLKQKCHTVQLYVQLIEHGNWMQLKFPIRYTITYYNIYLDLSYLQFLWHDFFVGLEHIRTNYLDYVKEPSKWRSLYPYLCVRRTLYDCMILMSDDDNKYSRIHPEKCVRLFSLSVVNSCQCVIPPFNVIPW